MRDFSWRGRVGCTEYKEKGGEEKASSFELLASSWGGKRLDVRQRIFSSVMDGLVGVAAIAAWRPFLDAQKK
jgi:hypothetical protein